MQEGKWKLQSNIFVWLILLLYKLSFLGAAPSSLLIKASPFIDMSGESS